MRRPTVLAFSRSSSPRSVLNTVTCRMLPAPPSNNSEKWPTISAKAKLLRERQPAAAALIEELLDELLEDVS